MNSSSPTQADSRNAKDALARSSTFQVLNDYGSPASIFFLSIEDAKAEASVLAAKTRSRYYITQVLGYVEAAAPPTKWTWL